MSQMWILDSMTGRTGEGPWGGVPSPTAPPSLSDEATALGKQGSETHRRCLGLNKILLKNIYVPDEEIQNCKKRVGGGGGSFHCVTNGADEWMPSTWTRLQADVTEFLTLRLMNWMKIQVSY